MQRTRRLRAGPQAAHLPQWVKKERRRPLPIPDCLPRAAPQRALVHGQLEQRCSPHSRAHSRRTAREPTQPQEHHMQ
eukprot:1161463-Alexandrium_andersonii.AAC.1